MCPLIKCLIWWKVTLIVFVCLFPTVCFHMCPQAAFMNEYKVTLVAFVGTFLQCVFSRVSSNCLSEKTFSHIGCIFIGPMCTCCKEERMLNSSHIIFLLGPQQNNMIVSTDANIEMQITYHYFSIFLIAVSTIWDVLCWCGESAHSSSCLSRCIQDSWGVLLKGWEERRMWGQLLEPVHCCSESRWK